MFIGHFAVGFAAKRAAPSLSLGTWFLAAQLADLIWPIFVLIGLERVEIDPGNTVVTPLNFVSYPYSHSLVAMTGWGLAAALGAALWRRASLSAATAVCAVVVSHWVLDAISHRPDMPLTIFGASRVGLGLWNSLPATVLVEAAMLIVGLAAYLRRPGRPTGRRSIGLWALVGFLVLINIANLAGPPPPSATAVAVAACAMWLIVLWAYRVDRGAAPGAHYNSRSNPGRS